MSPNSLLEPTYWNWWLLALVLIILEMVVPGTFLLWSGIAALLVGLLVWLIPALSIQVQWVLFALFTITALWVGRRFLKHYRPVSDALRLNQRGLQYIGRVVMVDTPVVNGQGKVRIGDTVWKIAAPDCPAGTRLKVIGAEGVLLQGEIIPAESWIDLSKPR